MEDPRVISMLKSLIKDGTKLRNDLMEAPLSTWTPVIEHNREYHQIAEKWRISCMNILELRFRKSFFFKEFREAIDTRYSTGSRYCKNNVGRALGILEAVLEALESGMTEDLFYKREVILFGDLLDQANEFLKKGFDLAAAIYGRIILETVVKEFAGKNDIQENSFDETIVALKKASVISQPLEHSLRANYAIGTTATHNYEDFKKISKQDIKNFLDFIRDKVLTL
jgi:hypothetical protein